MNKSILLFFTCIVILVASMAAQAEPVEVWSENGPQDPLSVNGWVHELGSSESFPADELIVSEVLWPDSTPPPCPDNYQGGLNIRVDIINVTNKDWSELWYVADPETTLTNHDGWINGQLAFKIDSVGLNRPLILEDKTVNGIFEPLETWRFVIQDYVNSLSLRAAFFGSIGIPSGGDMVSSGSIIAIPEPTTIVLLGLGSLALLRRRK